VEIASELYGKPWEPREYLIVLASYFICRGRIPALDSPEIQRLSSLLGRTPAAIAMRMENFASLDKDASRKGLRNISPMCRKVFDAWSFRPDHLQATVDYLIEEISQPHQLGLFGTQRARTPHAFDRYELLDRIGEGGFGEVYSCIHRESGKQFAIKIIRADKAQDDEALHRFSREMRALKSLDSPYVIRLYEDNLESESRLPAFIMELGVHSLSSYAQSLQTTTEPSAARTLLPTQEAINVMRSVLAAVKALHSQQPRILHRDINPNNILQLHDGRWVLADLGLAKFLGVSRDRSSFSTFTQRGWATTYFAPPEQHQYFKHTDEKADIYALGILLWELFSPSWPPPRIEKSQLSEDLAEVFRCSANPEYDERYASVSQLATSFEAAILSLA
jgi:hypothetical protein